MAHKMYTSLVALFLDIVQGGLEGIVVQGYTGEHHVYFVVEKFDLQDLQSQCPQLSHLSKLGRAHAGEFKAEINWEDADMDVHEFSLQGIVCLSCDYVGSLNFNSGVPADRANEVWKAFLKHQKTVCKQIDLHMER